jgi:hypothetical protein
LIPLLEREDSFVHRQASIALGKLFTDDPTALVGLLRKAMEGTPPLFLEGLIVALRETRAKTEDVAIAFFLAYMTTVGRSKKEALLGLRAIRPDFTVQEHLKSTNVLVPPKWMVELIEWHEKHNCPPRRSPK